jgi:hypothetical protein
MKKVTFLFLYISTTIFGQVNTEVHVFDIVHKEGVYLLKNKVNISNNEGYDSQPFFYTDNEILFASSKNGNTEIILHHLVTGENKLKSNTKNGGEYSPQRIPNSDHISAVRLDNDGLQRFYKYDYTSKKSTALIPDLKVAYPNWFDQDMLIAVSIVNDSLELFICDLKKKTNTTIAKNAGRSVHRIPNTNLISFISKENKEYWLVKSLNIVTKEIKKITSIGLSEDVTWLPNGLLLISKGNTIYKFDPKKDKNPSIFFRFTDENINNISRIAVNSDGTKLALVAEVSQ